MIPSPAFPARLVQLYAIAVGLPGRTCVAIAATWATRAMASPAGGRSRPRRALPRYLSVLNVKALFGGACLQTSRHPKLAHECDGLLG